ncbi:hypothetical protein JOF56_005775 [Kibdelosporangium banguiense]|uniref:Uncharacterized protein n=1 Tax=Kibdelosporangium banguiense TaxID=1365924 RepID=A0ABS4TLV8_9PSEU|nr:hypothetical protein [Kibdelosporangium banguiense]MBP2325390.1 hypothetical protein [Kibdelosporangium banguiense]
MAEPGDNRNEISGSVQADGVVQAGEIHGDVHIGARRRPLLVMASVATTAVVVAAITLWPKPTPPADQPPPAALTLTAVWDTRCVYRLAGDDRPPGMPDALTASADLFVGAQNRSEEEVIILGIRVVLRHRAGPPTTGELTLVEPCPASRQPLHGMIVDFDTEPLQVRMVPEDPGPALVGTTPTPAQPSAVFPFKVSRGDPEAFRFNFESARCDCVFDLAVDWVSNGEPRESALGPYRIVPHVEALVRK